MVDNRYATALVIGSVLSLLASVYLSVAVGTQYWCQYRSPPASNDANNGSDLRMLKSAFNNEDVSEYDYSTALFRLNGSVGLWWRCILVRQTSDSKMVSDCEAFTLAQQFEIKHQNDSSSEEDFLRTYLWRCRFIFPLVSLGLVFLAALVGVCACLCRSFTPTLFVGMLHLLAGLCSMATVCCFLAGMHLLHQKYGWPEGVVWSLGWSLYLALVSSPLQMMAAALFIWAARSHRKNYTRMTAYRVA
ncbi:hypothetical protein AMELA_G00271320 [Ameiurus melas]|uniref:Claudin domain containing 1 n=1 Tax=Ameiurus melas TaxID=219545 RepID=A0A7J5ZQ03_AMEME|nr:hypothetical protein AMELA_G00271320 [Ameiurus melas]